MRFPPSLLDEIRTRLPVSQVVARKVALKRAGRELKGLSPFKQERTPSFFVNDHKGSWFDFSSGQNGDIFKFVMLTEGLSFPEAVERLAEEAGLPMPKAGPREAEQEDERTRLYALLEAAGALLRRRSWRQPAAPEARRYLDKRGLDADAIARFRLGYAPNAGRRCKEHLAKAGFSAADMVASGMLVAGDDIPVGLRPLPPPHHLPDRRHEGPRDRLRRPRAGPGCPRQIPQLAGDAALPQGRRSSTTPTMRAAPPTTRARSSSSKATWTSSRWREAGFPQTVAPLGTALTEDQIRLLWRMAPEPMLCFDGDAAGRRAAFRAVETVLPHLKPGFSVQFAFLPDGLDPDDLIRQHGAASFQAMLDTKTAAAVRRADRARGAAGRARRHARAARLPGGAAQGPRRPHRRPRRARPVRDASCGRPCGRRTARLVRAIWRAADGRRDARFAGKRRNNTAARLARRGARDRADAAAAACRAARPRSPRLPCAATSWPSAPMPLPAREALLMRTLLNHPWLLEARCEEVAELTLTSPPLIRLRDALLELLAQNIALDRVELRSQLTTWGSTRWLPWPSGRSPTKATSLPNRKRRPREVEAGWRHAVALQRPRLA